ncbi:NPCBM/NEW2 domain-containing protein [Paenibacillus sp. N3.4]|uniref:NPCBM/NEW2 domain-containing protein n=1 Tax=Paenibacillus sp. N3.4 TaxID=2603222 RepID=UPI0011CC83A2|nr:NPCBM/NEW2 domain-containing protein [Paenibacillus sp. N3.4]TXK84406.1 hypothetical protein FU659_09295 [Paenibacillus sp. N3.4]
MKKQSYSYLSSFLAICLLFTCFGFTGSALAEPQQTSFDYLSDLNWTNLVNGKVATKKDQNASGRQLIMNGINYSKGIGSHPDTTITYRLGGKYSRFTSTIGIDDQALENTKFPTKIKFTVYADGVIKYESPIMTAKPYMAPIPVDLDITGVDEFKLVLTGHADGTNPQTTGYGDWADARLIKAGQSLSAADVALGITSIPAPAKNDTILTLPTVPDGFTVAIKSSNNEAVIPLDAQIFPTDADTSVTLVLKVTRVSDNSTADTAPIQVLVPAIQIVENVNKTALTEAISTANSTYSSAVEGTVPGQYPSGSKAALLSEILAAQSVMDYAKAKQAEIDAATASLNQALTAFLASVIVDSNSELASVTLIADKDTLNLDGLATLSLSGKMSDGKVADLSSAVVRYSTNSTDKIASINRVGSGAEVRAGTKINSPGSATVTATVTLNGITKVATVPFTVKLAADKPWTHQYHQTLTMKMFLCENNGTVRLTFEQGLEAIKKIDQLTRGIPKIIYLVGWQYDGHDTGYPAFDVVNPKLKRAQDVKAEDSLSWLMDEAFKYNTTVSFHINMLDASPKSPLWQTYLDADVIAKETNGDLRSYVWGYPISYKREWEAGLTMQRIDKLLELFPVQRAGTIHIDAFHQNIPGLTAGFISPFHGITSQEEAEYQKKIIRYFREKGIDVTAEFDKNYRVDQLVGLQAMAWHIRWSNSEQYSMPPSLYIGGDGGYDLLGTGMLGEGTIKSDPNNLKGFLEEFSLKTLPWYYLNRLNRVSNQQGVKVTFSNNVTSEKVGSNIVIKQNGRVMQDGTDVFFPALWNEGKGKEIIAFSKSGYTNKTWTLPDDWANTTKVDVYSIGLTGLTLVQKDKPVSSGAVMLSLTAGQGVSIVPTGTSDVKNPGAFQLLMPANGASGVDPSAATFNWEAAIDADSYQLTIADDPEFRNVVIDQTMNSTSKNVTGLLADKKYYWKVTAKNEQSGGTTMNSGGAASFITKLTISAADVAAFITGITPPVSDATVLKLPTVPAGFTVRIKSTSNSNVIKTDGTIIPPGAKTDVTLVLEVTSTLDGSAASTEAITVAVPARTSTSTTYDTSKATLFGSTSVANSALFATGKKIKNVGNNANNYVIFNNINVSDSGAYNLQIEYATGQDRAFYVSVNGGTGIYVPLQAGPDFNVPFTTTVLIELQAGANSIKIYNNSAYGPDLGVITISSVSPIAVAAGITAITAPLQGASSLTLPTVPSGFTVTIKSSDRPEVIQTNGTINPPSADTTVSLVLEVTRTSDGSKAITGSIPVLVPGVPVSASPQVTLNGTDSIYAEGLFDLKVGTQHVKGSIYGYDISIDYDPSQIDLFTADTLKDGLMIVDKKAVSGQLRILAVVIGDDKAANANGDLLVIHGKAKSLAQSATASISASLVVANGDGLETPIGGATHEIQITYVNKAALNSLITDAQNTLNAAVEGSQPGQYPVGSKADLKAAFDRAKAVAGNPAATQQQVQLTAVDLSAALQAFKALIITGIPGDLNGDGKVSIGDLAIVAKYYGKSSADSDWDPYKFADVNHDGMIDITDLAIIAQKILYSE